MTSVSYLVTCSNENETLIRLFTTLKDTLCENDEIITLIDAPHCKIGEPSYEAWINIIGMYRLPFHSEIIEHSLDNDYGKHKNIGIENCHKEYIFSIDGDELPPENLLGENLHALIEANIDMELFLVSRLNDFRGVTPEIANQWGWTLTNSKIDGIAQGRPLVNWLGGDRQGRIFKNDYPRIHWEGRLHERIQGHNKYTSLPKEEDWALYHDKSIAKQLETNLKYNKDFTISENRGYQI